MQSRLNEFFMITLIHGDNIEESRKALIGLKEKFKSQEVRVLDGRSIDLTMLAQALHSDSLFGKVPVVIIENAMTFLAKKTKHLEQLLSGVDSILWEGKVVPASLLKYLGKADVRLFKTPTIIFQFLDSLAPNKSKYVLDLYEKLEETQAPEVIFLMISRRFRQLLMISDQVVPESMQPWQLQKLKNQTKLFDKILVHQLYAKLLDIDVSIKSGASPFSLASHIRQFLLML